MLYTPDREHFGIVPVEAMYVGNLMLAFLLVVGLEFWYQKMEIRYLKKEIPTRIFVILLGILKHFINEVGTVFLLQ